MGKSNTLTITAEQPTKIETHLYLGEWSGKTRGPAPLSITLTATLLYPNDISPIPGKVIKFYDSGGNVVGTATTDSNGQAKLPLTLSLPGTYTFYAVFEGDDTFQGC